MTLGSTIRDAREAARISVESLSESTSIRIGLLTEMESNNFAHCGGDTYARGHLRNIAAKVGIDPQVFIDLYNEEHSTEHRAIQDLLAENNVMQVPREAKKISWKVPAGVSLAILLVLGIGQIVISNQSSEVETTPTPTPSVVASESAAPLPSTSAVATASSTPRSGPISLTISAVRGNSYIDIVVDGKHVSKGSMFQGENKSFTGQTAISVYLSNPAGLDLTLNGKALAPLGGQNEEVRRTFR
ncbi:COG1426 Predicted transcriptional regulator contains Xre-like HTH domain [Candidatus Nanopelagicaceae bacterium]